MYIKLILPSSLPKPKKQFHTIYLQKQPKFLNLPLIKIKNSLNYFSRSSNEIDKIHKMGCCSFNHEEILGGLILPDLE